MVINSYAPIIPGEGAASITLSDSVDTVLQGTTVDFVVERQIHVGMGDIGMTRYRSAFVDFWAKDNFVVQIMVHDGYAGKILEKVGLGSTIVDVESQLGSVIVVDDNLVVRGIHGLCFEPQSETRDSPIIEIYVWKPDWAEIQLHNYL